MFVQVPTSVTIINSCLIGYFGVSLTDFSASSASLIAAGSALEVGGAFFTATEDITPSASSWTAITTATTAYLSMVPSGTAGSQIISAAWVSGAPVWSTSKQGWYASAASVSRVVASAYKNSPTSYLYKKIIENNPPQFTGWQGEVVKITSSSGNWTVPDNVYKLKVICVGGGGGGGAGGGGGTYMGGGGGSGTCIGNGLIEILSVYPGQVVAYSVGAGGTGGAGATATAGTGISGSAGTVTTFGSVIGLGGNGGGGGDSSGSFGQGGLGTGSYGDSGGNGGPYFGGKGGGSGGRGGFYGSGSVSGTNGLYGGGGGGGAPNNLGGAGAGGNGGSGIIIIEY